MQFSILILIQIGKRALELWISYRRARDIVHFGFSLPIRYSSRAIAKLIKSVSFFHTYVKLCQAAVGDFAIFISSARWPPLSDSREPWAISWNGRADDTIALFVVARCSVSSASSKSPRRLPVATELQRSPTLTDRESHTPVTISSSSDSVPTRYDRAY